MSSILKSSYSKLSKDGLLFFDIRNWDTINEEKPIIQAIDPIKMTAEEHMSRYLLFNWHDNGSVTFSFATSTEKNRSLVFLNQHFIFIRNSRMFKYPFIRSFKPLLINPLDLPVAACIVHFWALFFNALNSVQHKATPVTVSVHA